MGMVVHEMLGMRYMPEKTLLTMIGSLDAIFKVPVFIQMLSFLTVTGL